MKPRNGVRSSGQPTSRRSDRGGQAPDCGCVMSSVQPPASPDARNGSSVEMLRLSISRLLFLTKADADRASAECTVGQGPRSHAARNAAFIGNDEPCHASEQRDRLVRVAALGFLEIEENWVFTLPRRRGPDPGDLDAPAGPPFAVCRPRSQRGLMLSIERCEMAKERGTRATAVTSVTARRLPAERPARPPAKPAGSPSLRTMANY